jgi:hypothetical protein
VKSLAQEYGASPAPVNPVLFAAGGDNQRNAAIALDLMSRLIPVALAAQRGDQPWSQYRSRSRKRVHKGIVRMLPCVKGGVKVSHCGGRKGTTDAREAPPRAEGEAHPRGPAFLFN